MAVGQVILGDKGFAGKELERFIIKDRDTRSVRPDRKDEKPRHENLGDIRQWVESVFDTFKGQLGFEHHGDCTIEGLYARIADKLPVLAASIWHNWKSDAPRKRYLTVYDR